jgi:uncharacterized protein (TIGR03086 family)
MDLVPALDHTFRHTQRIVANVHPDQYGDKTPCTEWTVRDLLEHMIGVVAGIGGTAAGAPSEPFALTDDPAEQFAAVSASTLTAWQAPGVLEREFDGPGGRMPGRVLASINLLDTATHSWDLAVATGQPSALPDDVAVAALEASEMIVTPQLRPGRFGPQVEVGAAGGDGATERLVAFLGRTP